MLSWCHSRESGNPVNKLIWIPNQVGNDTVVGNDRSISLKIEN